MPRCLNLSELTYARRRAVEPVRRPRPRRAGRVRAYASSSRTLAGAGSSGSPRPPRVPGPRRPLDTVPLDVLHAVLSGLRRLEVSA